MALLIRPPKFIRWKGFESIRKGNPPIDAANATIYYPAFADFQYVRHLYAIKFFLTAILVGFFTSSLSNADVVRYTFSGELPTGASQHSEVSDGETFTASFTVMRPGDDLFPDDPTLGLYGSAVVEGTLSFSGGYVSPLDFSGFNVVVGDNNGMFKTPSMLAAQRISLFSKTSNTWTTWTR